MAWFRIHLRGSLRHILLEVVEQTLPVRKMIYDFVRLNGRIQTAIIIFMA